MLLIDFYKSLYIYFKLNNFKISIIAGFQNQARHHCNEGGPHKDSAMFQRHLRAQQAAQHIGHQHHRYVVPPDVALADKHRQRRQIAGHV